MGILKNSRVATKYRVSNPTVGKWITAAQDRKNNLEITKVKNKNYILDTEANHKELAFLAERGGKYKNKIGYELVEPNPKIYKVFTKSQLIELIVNLRKGVLPTKFTYFNEGVKCWNQISVNSYNSRVLSVIDTSLEYLIFRFKKYEVINLIDIGVGNGLPVKILIEKFLKSGFKVNYTGIDISPEMIEILRSNLNKWFGKKINIDTKIADIEHTVIRDILYDTRVKNRNSTSCNLVLMLGCTIGNFVERERVLKNISASMTIDDYYLFDAEIKSPIDYGLVSSHLNSEIAIREDTWLLEFLGLKNDFYQREKVYISELDSQANFYKLKKDVDIKIKFDDFEDYVNLESGDKIQGITIHSFNIEKLISEAKKASFFIDYLSSDHTRSEALLLAEVKKMQESEQL